MVLPSQIRKSKNRTARKRNLNPSKDDIVYDVYQKSVEAKTMVNKVTGIVYCEKMVEHKCLWDSNYPECPERFTEILSRCEELKLLSRCERIPSRMAEIPELLRVHSKDHINALQRTENYENVELLEEMCTHYDAIYVNSKTYEAASLAAGSAVNLVDAICKQKVQNGMALIRPPGHHAMESEYCGYCFFNNIAIATHHAILNCGMSRILIVDWDVHHGQATQRMFYDDPRVLYFSIHRYEHGTFWPNLRESDYDFIGNNEGKGFNFNLPLNETGLGNSDYLAIFHNVLLPVATEYQPEIVLISAGYDAALGCPEGEMVVTPACYAHLVTSLTGLANGKVAVILEGGYCLKSLAEGAALTLRALLGDPCPKIDCIKKLSQSVCDTILNVIYTHRNYWNCFKFQGSYSISDESKENAHRRHLPVIQFNFDGSYPTVFSTRDCYAVQSSEVLNNLNDQLNRLILGTRLFSPPTHKVCFVYDTGMLEHRNLSDLEHPEKPDRISSIFDTFEEYQLLQRLHKLPSRRITEEELSSVHSKQHICNIADLKFITTAKELNRRAKKYSSVYFHQESYNSACIAAGSLLQVVDSVLNNESTSGVALIRPPGHHADEEEPCGFCMFNNVALAAKYAINAHGLTRVLIIDWDVHHGNGTQQIFESDPSVLYISIHRFDNGRFFPSGPQGGHTYVGVNKGAGYNINIPWSEKGMGNVEYIAALHHIVLPIAYQFNPELVLVSAGFDAACGDPLGGCKVSPDAYAQFTHWLMPLANGKVILCLEGGYNIRSVSLAMTMCAKALLDDPLPTLETTKLIKTSAVAAIKKVMLTHSEFWPVLAFAVDLPCEEVLPKQDTTYKSKFRSVDNNETGEYSQLATDLHTVTELTSAVAIIDSDIVEATDINTTSVIDVEDAMKLNISSGHVSGTTKSNISSVDVVEAMELNTSSENVFKDMELSISFGDVTDTIKPNISSGDVTDAMKSNISSGDVTGTMKSNISSSDVVEATKLNTSSDYVFKDIKGNISSEDAVEAMNLNNSPVDISKTMKLNVSFESVWEATKLNISSESVGEAEKLNISPGDKLHIFSGDVTEVLKLNVSNAPSGDAIENNKLNIAGSNDDSVE